MKKRAVLLFKYSNYALLKISKFMLPICISETAYVKGLHSNLRQQGCYKGLLWKSVYFCSSFGAVKVEL